MAALALVGLAPLARRARRALGAPARAPDGQPRVAVVCGGSRGLGRAIAHRLAERGFAVAICARSAHEVDRVLGELNTRGIPFYGEACDLRDPEQVAAFLANVEHQLGPVDVLVANAATISVGPIASRTAKDFEEAMASTFLTALHPALETLPRMRARGRGTIAFITSIGGKMGVPHLAPYCAAKFAAVGLAETLRAEARTDGVRVLTVVPGLMRTGSHVRATFKGDPAKELAWFSAGAVTPVMAIDADRAARRIVRAIERGATEIVLSAPAHLAVAARALVPSFVRGALAIAGALLPRAASKAREVEGRHVEAPSSRLLRFVRAYGDHLAERHAQIGARRISQGA